MHSLNYVNLKYDCLIIRIIVQIFLLFLQISIYRLFIQIYNVFIIHIMLYVKCTSINNYLYLLEVH